MDMFFESAVMCCCHNSGVDFAENQVIWDVFSVLMHVPVQS